MKKSKAIEIQIVEIRGNCPVFSVGDRITIQGAEIALDTTDALCTHALPSLLYYALALREGADPVALGLSKHKDVAFIQCPDPGEPLTQGGTVIFKLIKK